jgi:NAD(P)-dependent dehydrogenase (short-subunit alcohol dehydrogenase family)
MRADDGKGIIYIKDAIDQSAAEYKRVLETNCLGNFICCRTFARQIRPLGTKKGSIVMISSMSARIANQGLSSFGMNSSKAAICQMARSFSVEWAPLGIRVNTISPGYIASPIPKERYAKDPESLKVIEALGRISTPEEYRGAAIFMSDASSFMTGSDLVIDGGHTAW